MKKRRKRPGPKVNLQQHQLTKFAGLTKEVAERIKAGEPANYHPRIYEKFDIKPIRSITDKKPYGEFRSIREAFSWWEKNKKAYMEEDMEKYLRDQSGRFAKRPNIFWEMCYGVSYPDEETCVAILEQHEAWYEGERDRAITAGATFLFIERPCVSHAHGRPLIFPYPEAPILHLDEDGRLQRRVVEDCVSTMKAIEKNQRKTEVHHGKNF